MPGSEGGSAWPQGAELDGDDLSSSGLAGPCLAQPDGQLHRLAAPRRGAGLRWAQRAIAASLGAGRGAGVAGVPGRGGLWGLPGWRAGPRYRPWRLLGVVALLYIGGFWSGA